MTSNEPEVLQLTAAETKLCKRLIPYIVCKVGLAVHESGTKASAQLHEESSTKYLAMIDAIDIGAEHFVKIMMVSDPPRECAIGAICKYLKSVIRDESDTSRIWQKLAVLKSEFRNYWMPNFEVRSGENTMEGPLFRVLQHVWAYRKNRSIKNSNRKSKNSDNQKALVNPCDAPVSINQNVEMYDKVPTFIHIIKDHAFFHKNTPPASTDTEAKDNAVAKSVKSRKQQRIDEADAHKRRKIKEKNDSSKNFDNFLVAQAAAATKVAKKIKK